MSQIDGSGLGLRGRRVLQKVRREGAPARSRVGLPYAEPCDRSIEFASFVSEVPVLEAGHIRDVAPMSGMDPVPEYASLLRVIRRKDLLRRRPPGYSERAPDTGDKPGALNETHGESLCQDSLPSHEIPLVSTRGNADELRVRLYNFGS